MADISHRIANLLTIVGLQTSNNLFIIGDFNLPGATSGTTDTDLEALLDVYEFHQQVSNPSR